MLTDDDARRLLNRAGETVTVDPAAPIDDRPRRRVWPILAAAAAVIAIAAATILFTAPRTHDPAPAPSVTDEIQIPSTLGYDLNRAVDALREVGLSSRVETEPTCNGTYVRGTEPAAGTPVDPGAEIVVQYAQSDGGFCFSEEQFAVDLLALADGRGGGPQLASDVAAYDAVGVAHLEDVLGRFSAAAHAYYPAGTADRYLSPSLAYAGRDYDVVTSWAGCNYSGGPAFPGRDYVRVGVLVSEGGRDCPEFAIDVYRNKQGQVDAVVERALGEGSTPDPTLGTALRDFARGGELPPMADQVDLYLGNAFTGFVTKASASDRTSWATCTELGDYAGISCPLSPLDVLKQHPTVEYLDSVKDPCLQTYGPVPPDLLALDRVVIVPAEGSVDSCIDDFAVQLFANDDGELVAVSLLLGEP